MPWLREQFRLLKPKIVVCLGRIAAQRMIREEAVQCLARAL